MIDGIPIAQLTPSALLGITVVLLLLGRIVPRSTLVDKANESAKWQAAYEAEREARITSQSQTTELLELAKTTHSFIVATFSNSERIRKSGETDNSIGEPDVVYAKK